MVCQSHRSLGQVTEDNDNNSHSTAVFATSCNGIETHVFLCNVQDLKFSRHGRHGVPTDIATEDYHCSAKRSSRVWPNGKKTSIIIYIILWAYLSIMRKPCETTWHDPTHSVLQTMQLMSCTPGSSQISSIALAKRKWYGKCKINTSAFRATSTATWQALRWGHCIFRHHPSCTAVDGLEVWPATQRTSMNQESKVSAPWTAQTPSKVQCMINLQISETPH